MYLSFAVVCGLQIILDYNDNVSSFDFCSLGVCFGCSWRIFSQFILRETRLLMQDCALPTQSLLHIR